MLVRWAHARGSMDGNPFGRPWWVWSSSSSAAQSLPGGRERKRLKRNLWLLAHYLRECHKALLMGWLGKEIWLHRRNLDKTVKISRFYSEEGAAMVFVKIVRVGGGWYQGGLGNQRWEGEGGVEGAEKRQSWCWELRSFLKPIFIFLAVQWNRVIPNQFIFVWKHLSLPCLCLCLGLHPQKGLLFVLLTGHPSNF